jgi:membrane protease YdiL (CAAX protease family)
MEFAEAAPAAPVSAPGWWRAAPGPLREAPRGEAPAAAAGRYRVRRVGRERVLVCLEAPTVQVRIEPGGCVSATAARSAPPGTIYLDGAAQGEPFVDPERDVYNLDHHEGCVRAFTLATCEQAMVLLRRGLDLRRRDWTVHANGVDLDTVLAIWVLLNHLRLAPDDSPARRRILPLLRLEGNIDALGLGTEDLCGLPAELHTETRRQLDALLERERGAKSRGLGRDPLAFVAAQLRAVDRIAYAGEELGELLEIEEIARAELAGAGVAVVCRADGGIYEVERELRRLHGARLGLVVLQKDAKSYSLRPVHPAAAAQLERIYLQLNRVDPGSDGSLSDNRWGGAGEIGGSPRKSGTRLGPHEIANACRDACTRWTPAARVRRVLTAALGALALLGAGFAPLALPSFGAGLAAPGTWAALALFAVVAATCLAGGRRAPGFYGLRLPRGLAGWAWLPVALAAGALGGVWVPGTTLPASFAPPDVLLGAALLAGPAALELLFRGFVTARLLPAFSGRALVFVPVLPALAYTGLLAALPPAVAPVGPPGTALAAAFAFGLASGAARERNDSVALPVLFAWLGAAALLARAVLA